MKTLIILFMVFLLNMINSSMNPIKASMTMIFLSVLIFFTMYISSGSSWFPMIFFMLFIGGIMIMFMILSSLLPNEKSMKLNSFSMIMFMFTIFIYYLSHKIFSNFSSEINNTNQMKLFTYHMYSFEFIMILILLYFFSFIFLLSKENTSMRSEA